LRTLKIRGGRLKKNIEIKAGEQEYVEIPCREGSTIYIDASEMDDDDFNVALLPSSDVKKAPLIGTVLEFRGVVQKWE
jgi:hypothetical protein